MRIFEALYCIYCIFCFSQGQELGDVLRSTSGANATIAKQGCHPFYESLIDEPYIADVSLEIH